MKADAPSDRIDIPASVANELAKTVAALGSARRLAADPVRNFWPNKLDEDRATDWKLAGPIARAIDLATTAIDQALLADVTAIEALATHNEAVQLSN